MNLSDTVRRLVDEEMSRHFTSATLFFVAILLLVIWQVYQSMPRETRDDIPRRVWALAKTYWTRLKAQWPKIRLLIHLYLKVRFRR